MTAPSAGTPDPPPILGVDHVSKAFVISHPLMSRLRREPPVRLHAVVDVSLELSRGETVGLVGESGCGKTTLGRMIAGLMTPDRGAIRCGGEDLRSATPAVRLQTQMVFQNPYSSLNPRMTIGEAIAEPLRVHRIVPSREVGAETARLLDEVGLAASIGSKYPFELSGGQRQRAAIARSLSVRPQLLVADEAVASLDVSTQAQVLNLLADLRDHRGLSLVFITHNLNIVEHLCDRVIVMYLGRAVETAPAERLFTDAGHPYTRGLIAAIPRIEGPRKRRQAAVAGELPSPISPPSGCVFRTRCPRAEDVCTEVPPSVALGTAHAASCFFAAEVAHGAVRHELGSTG